MPNSLISQIVIGSNTYDIKDADARARISALESYTDYLGVTTTTLVDGVTTSPVVVIPGKYVEVTPQSGDNPKSKGWYEYDAQDEEYVLTNDETVTEGKKYYTTSITAVTGNIVTVGSTAPAAEFIYNGTTWQEFGDLSALGDLAYVDTAEGSYTPAGSVSTRHIGCGTVG